MKSGKLTEEIKKCATCQDECYLVKHTLPYRDEVFCSDDCLHDRILKVQQGETFCPTCFAPLDHGNSIYLDIGFEFCCNQCMLCYIEATDQTEEQDGS